MQALSWLRTRKSLRRALRRKTAPSGAQQFAALTVGGYHSLTGPVIGPANFGLKPRMPSRASATSYG